MNIWLNVPAEPTRTHILMALIELRRAGKFQSVWCDGDRLHVRFQEFGERIPMSWKEAVEITGIQEVPQCNDYTKKPVASETLQYDKLYRFQR